MQDKWYKRNDSDKIWWLGTLAVGEFIFSFDKEKQFNLFRDYPFALTKEQVELFDKENPYWAKFFADRKEGKK